MDPTKVETDKEALINHPPHYTQYLIEPVTFVMRNKMEFWRGNIIKYASRAGSKMYEGMDEIDSEVTDLEKVKRYADIRINMLRGQTEL